MIEVHGHLVDLDLTIEEALQLQGTLAKTIAAALKAPNGSLRVTYGGMAMPINNNGQRLPGLFNVYVQIPGFKHE